MQNVPTDLESAPKMTGDGRGGALLRRLSGWRDSAVIPIGRKILRLAFLTTICGAAIGTSCVAAPAPCNMFDAQANDAQARRVRGDLAGAQSVVNQILKADPRDFRANYTQGLIFMDQSGIDRGPTGYDKSKFRAGLDRLLTTASLLEAMTGPCLVTAKANGFYSIYNTLGVYYFNSGDYKSAEQVWLKAESKLSLMEPRTQYRVLNNLGLVYRQDHLNQPSLSSAYFLKALTFRRSQNSSLGAPAPRVSGLIPKFNLKPTGR